MSHALLFPGGDPPGYLLVKTIHEGTQGQVLIVRSIADGNLYIRKKFIISIITSTSEETTFYHYLPTSMAPTLVPHTEYEKRGDAIVKSFCNGGSLATFITACKKKDKVIAEALFGDLVRQICELLALTNSCWTPEDGMLDEWRPIIHTDIHEGNILSHWPSDTSDYISISSVFTW